MSRKQKRRPEQGQKRAAERSIGECISAVARAVIVEQQPLRSAWRQYSRENGLRDLRVEHVDAALLDALRSEAELFGGERYRGRVADAEQAQLAISQLLAPRQLHVSGLSAHGLAPDDSVLEMLVFEDEAEALLRDLLDRTIDFQTDQLHWSTRRDGEEQIQPAVVIGTPWLDVRVSVLPPSWERLPLFQQGQAIWTQKLSPEDKRSAAR